VIDNSIDGFAYSIVKDYWRQFSPMHNIDATTPPTAFFLGTEDRLISVETARKYKKIMEEAGSRCDLHLYEGQPHGFFNEARYYETTLEMDKFLTSLGYIKGKPTIKKQCPK
jgi:dienelactone hydrolase